MRERGREFEGEEICELRDIIIIIWVGFKLYLV